MPFRPGAPWDCLAFGCEPRDTARPYKTGQIQNAMPTSAMNVPLSTSP